METIELQNHIIKKVLNTTDTGLLSWLNDLLSKSKEESPYQLSDFEKRVLQESFIDYKKGNIIENDDLFKRNEEWLKE